MKRRFQRERENFLKYGHEKILQALVEVIDNFDRAIDGLTEDKEKKIIRIRKGLEMVRTQFLDILKANGLTPIEALGKEFDPNFHEAVGQTPLPKGKKENEIIQEFQKGYVLNGRALRAAKVVIAKSSEE